MKKQIVLTVVLVIRASEDALATTQEEEQACTNDAFQFCQNYIPDRNRVFTCLVSNRDQLSVACHTVMAPYLPPEPVALKKPSAPAPHDRRVAKSKGPLNLAPR